MKKRSALRLVDTRTLDRGQWLAVRQGGIGSSDAATAVGLNPYRSQLELWLEKTGRATTKEETTGMDDPCYWGTLLEPYVATAYQQHTGRKVRRVNAVLQHPTFNFMLANLDREVVGSPDVQILEYKTAGEFGSRLWKDGVPEYVQLQVQHQLAVTGNTAADVAVLLCGQKLEIHRIERDDEVIARMILLEAKFWACVERDIEPLADGSESSARALCQLYPGNDTTLDFGQDESLCEMFTSLSALKAELEAKERLAEQCKQTIQQSMGDASRAVFQGGEVTFRRSKHSTSLDAKRLAADYPNLTASYTVIRPGSRRFVLSIASDQ
ncbi:YqaJ viral recombinase family protein [Rhodanobacter ginsengiterrae]|uniref:YqaJ viral recombinase family nuclease n=1 Tax=Rhodanobacter ginsengiterrae TaxID=2008451 RepID=UPI003CFB4984